MVESCSFFFFKQKTAYEMRISDWSSDVCSSDLPTGTSPPKSPLLSDPPDLFFVTQIFPHRCILQCYTTSDRKPSLHHIKTRSEERRVGKECSVRVDLGGRRIINKKKKKKPSARTDRYMIKI